MLSFKDLKTKILSDKNLLEKFSYKGESVAITKDMRVLIDGELSDTEFDSIEEAKLYVKDYFDSYKDEDNVLSEHLLVNTIEKHYSQIKITHSLVEEYKETIKNKEFTIDPVVKELKNYDSFGKYEFVLNDGNKISISEDLHLNLSELLNNKYDIIEYMKESIDNFKSVLRKIRY